MSESVGDLSFDLIDLGISVRGKLKLVPQINSTYQINKFNSHNAQKFKLFYYGRQDLVRTYKQMNSWLLRAEIVSDIISLNSVIEDVKNVVVLDQESQETSIVVSAPEDIKNVGELIDSCEFIILITGEENPEHLGYYRCERPSGEIYKIYDDGQPYQ